MTTSRRVAVALATAVTLATPACRDGSSSTGSTTTSAKPSATELLRDATLDNEGLGFLQIGVSVAEIEERTGVAVAWECGGRNVGFDWPDNVVAVTRDGVVVRVEVHAGGDGLDVPSSAGIRIGDAVRAVRDAYPTGALTRLPDPADGTIELMATRGDRVVVYTAENGTVSWMRAGTRASTEPFAPCA